MKTVKYIRRIITICLLSGFHFNLYAAEPIVFTQLSSAHNQPATATVNLASLETVDGIENIGSTPTNITVNKAGFYFLLAVGQAGAINSAMIDGSQYVDIWLIRNGVPVPNSTARITVGQFTTGTVLTQNIMALNQNDKLSVGFAASAPTFGLIATPKKEGIPAIPSIIFTLYKVN
ncbi:MAG: hypothetical protein CK423_09500 [Legionella sp.]|nr:MAG: hypothetical protein CK423_09500 [Legionella sp.]